MAELKMIICEQLEDGARVVYEDSGDGRRIERSFSAEELARLAQRGAVAPQAPPVEWSLREQVCAETAAIEGTRRSMEQFGARSLGIALSEDSRIEHLDFNPPMR